jgi:myo-inositol-1(or 4)-monophosphatase
MAILSANINVMIRAAEKASKSLIRDFGEVENLQVSKKGAGDFVSAADHRSEEIIHQELSKARPEFGFLMEERGDLGFGSDEKQSRWIVDPLDGTSNFLNGLPHWCISIGLEQNGEITAGVVFDPIKNELYRAEKGNGAFMNNRRLRVSGQEQMQNACIAAGQPIRKPEAIAQFMREYQVMYEISGTLRRYGAAALDLCYVAAGRYDGFWERGLKSYDMAAGSIIVKEAGGLATTIDRKANPHKTMEILAGNPHIHALMAEILNK